MHHPLAWLEHELQSLEQRSLRRRLAARQGKRREGKIRMEETDWVDFSSNDYLGLAGGELVAAIQRHLPESGWGSGASPLVTGRSHLHAELERRLAQFERTEAALLFPTGFAANMGTVSALAGRGDIIFSDAKNHASIIDGCRLSAARVQIYPHNDITFLRDALKQAAGFRRRLIVTDSLFSMDGDFAPLDELAELAQRYEAMLMVDEAHATGVIGNDGRGVAELQGAEDGVHIRVGTLSKALGSIGGFVAGSQTLIDWLCNCARSYVFSTALPEVAAAAGIEALDIVGRQPQRRTSLLAQAGSLRRRLADQGWTVDQTPSQIIPVRIGDPAQTMLAASVLRDRGMFVPGIRPPSVPDGQSLLRISLSYAHTRDMLDGLCDALKELAR